MIQSCSSLASRPATARACSRLLRASHATPQGGESWHCRESPPVPAATPGIILGQTKPRSTHYRSNLQKSAEPTLVRSRFHHSTRLLPSKCVGCDAPSVRQDTALLSCSSPRRNSKYLPLRPRPHRRDPLREFALTAFQRLGALAGAALGRENSFFACPTQRLERQGKGVAAQVPSLFLPPGVCHLSQSHTLVADGKLAKDFQVAQSALSRARSDLVTHVALLFSQAQPIIQSTAADFESAVRLYLTQARVQTRQYAQSKIFTVNFDHDISVARYL